MLARGETMEFVADLHVHSRYSRATSPDATPENYYRWAVYKGVTLVGTGDFTHPAWREELQRALEPAEEGLYRLKEQEKHWPSELDPERFPWAGPRETNGRPAVRFVVSGEISTIYKKDGRVRKIHHLILLPGLEAAEALSRRLEAIGNLGSDGRPILGLDSLRLLEMVLEVCPKAVFIPAHIWTPHFSLLGANSGFDSLEECFEDLSGYISALETGLSSDPPMNWRVSALDRCVLVSNSDAHSPKNLAREANLLDAELSYPGLYRALTAPDFTGLMGTLEFFPEEGKYHYDGHRACRLRWHPAETRAGGGKCPVCGRPVTVGVLHRVEELADRQEGSRPAGARPYQSLVPLPEVIASALGAGTASQRVARVYSALLGRLGPELVVLRQAPVAEIAGVAGWPVAEAIRRVRAGEVKVEPGFDGEYGKIEIIRPEERQTLAGQAVLFFYSGAPAAEARSPAGKEAEKEETFSGVAGAESESAPAASPVPAGGPGDELTAEQREAVTAVEGPVVVLAGPGTGKTRTLVYRIVYLLREKGVPAGQIAALTFTNKAAREIRERVAALLGGSAQIEVLTVGTFHSLCLELLRRHFSFTLLDEPEARRVLAEVMAERGQKTVAADRLAARLSYFKSQGWGPESDAVPPELRPLYRAYQERLAAYRALDYDDLLLRTVELIEGQQDSGGEVPGFTHLLVDEFQDVNPVQYRLVRLWAGDGRNLFVIGDPDQAIYGFRGADRRLFERLLADYPGARVLRLRANFRSRAVIVRAARALMGDAAGRELVAVRPGGPKLLHLEVPGELAEGIAVVREIAGLVGGADQLSAHAGAQGLLAGRLGEGRWGFSDVAVLFRTGRQAELLEECFLKEGLPYRLLGRESFLDRPPVRQAMAFLRCVTDPSDQYHLWRCLAEGRFRVGTEAREKLEQAARDLGGPVPALEAAVSGAVPLAERDREQVVALMQALADFRQRAEQEDPESLVRRWAQEVGGEGEELSRLARIAGRFGDLRSFLRGVVLAQEGDWERPGAGTGAEAVSLMTLHAAKGLEFPVVFIVGVEEGLLPWSERSEEGRGGADPEEERRLFYVGLTRAQEAVVLLSCRTRTRQGSRVNRAPSPFLSELPADCLERIRLDAAAPTDASGSFRQLRLF
ncbi:MAG: UvrD-helicase domain-containing protein [Moorellales bacterium]